MFPKSEEKEAPFLFPSSSHNLAHLHYSHHLVFWVFVCFILVFVLLSCEPQSVPWPLSEILATSVRVDREHIPAVVGL